MFMHGPDCVMIHTIMFRGAKMKQGIVLIGAAMAIAAAGSTAALAKKAKPCDVVGFWTATITGTTTSVAGFEMSTNRKGVSPYPNPECKSETSAIHSTLITNTNWDTTIKSKRCKVVITTAATFAAGSCSTATGTLTIPTAGGPETLPITLNEVGGARRLPSRTLMNGFK
jgi:hypothetical protein